VSWSGAGGGLVEIGSRNDRDCDGDPSEIDCNDQDPLIGPSLGEICGNAIDDDCDGAIDEDEDSDGDQVTSCGGDCNDSDGTVHPGAREVCDGQDNDCNGICNDGELDGDGDSWNVCGEKIKADGSCVPEPFQECNDEDPAVNPDALEVCNGVDDNCNGLCDDGDGGGDVDGDGFTTCGSGGLGERCGDVNGAFADCDDGNSSIHPFADELCDGVDTNCDGSRMEFDYCYGGETMSCTMGTRTCDDDAEDGTAGFEDGCNTSGGDVPMPTEWCAQYDECSFAGDSDPWVCANSGLAAAKLHCDVYHVGGTLCSPRRQTLPGDPGLPLTCTYALLEGTDQEHWQVALDGGLGPTSTTDTCVSDFLVIGANDLIPQRDSIFVSYSDNITASSVILEIDVEPVPVPVCPTDGGMHCMLM
jgi:hypothetical protein